MRDEKNNNLDSISIYFKFVWIWSEIRAYRKQRKLGDFIYSRRIRKKNVTGTGTIEYTGEEPVPEKFDYMIHYKGNGSGTTGNELSNRKVHFGNFRCESCYFDESDELEVEVMWTGGKETIILNTNNE